MPNKLLIPCIVLSILGGCVAVAHAAPESSLAEHTEVLVWSIGALVTVLNAWVAYTLKNILSDLRDTRERLIKLETEHEIMHQK